MINLLPPQAKRAVVHEYWLRVITVWAILLIGALMAGCVLFLPSYVLIRSQSTALELEASTLRTTSDNVANAEGTIKESNLLAKELSNGTVSAMLSSVVTAIDTAASAGITLNTYEVARAGNMIESVKIQGVARSREALVSFEQRLEADELFDHADVPISDLVRGSDLPFTMTVTITKPSHE